MIPDLEPGSWPDPPRLDGGEVHLWRARVEDARGFGEGALGWLSDGERGRAERFQAIRDRLRFVARRGFLRGVLGRYLGRPPGELTFRGGVGEKPVLEGEELRFSLSHSAGEVLVAVALRELGVDLQSAADLADLELLAPRVLAPPELEVWRSLERGARADAMLLAWVRKEAFLKATGEGLSREPALLEVGIGAHPAGSAFRAAGADATFGTLVDLQAPPGFRAALAAAGEGWRVVEVEG